MLDVVTWFVFELCGVLTFGLKVATPEGVVRDSSDGDDGNGNVIDDSSSDEDENGLDPLEQARQAAKRHCGWVPSTSNGVEVRCTYRCGHDATHVRHVFLRVLKYSNINIPSQTTKN